jgi:hypothetical protein
MAAVSTGAAGTWARSSDSDGHLHDDIVVVQGILTPSVGFVLINPPCHVLTDIVLLFLRSHSMNFSCSSISREHDQDIYGQ